MTSQSTGSVRAARCNRLDAADRHPPLRFVPAHPQAASVLIGLAGPGQVRTTMANMAVPIPDGLESDLKSAGLLRDDAPVPASPTA